MLRRVLRLPLRTTLAGVGLVLLLGGAVAPAAASEGMSEPPGAAGLATPPGLPARTGTLVGEFVSGFVAGESRALNWYVRRANGQPYATGTVTVTGPSTPATVLPLDDHGSVRFHGSTLPVGTHETTVTYSGDSRYAPDTFAFTFEVAAAYPGWSDVQPRPLVTLDGPDQLVAGESPTYTVRATGTGPVPTGRVSVFSFDSDVPYDAEVDLVDGTATVTLPPATAGTYVMYAGYRGDAAYRFTNQAHAPIHLVVTAAEPTPTPDPAPAPDPATPTTPATPAPDPTTPTAPAAPTSTLAVPGRSSVALVGEARTDLSAPPTISTRQPVDLEARGFLPGESVDFVLHSDPVFLGTAVADAAGVARLTVALPAGVPAGRHHVIAAGLTSGVWSRVPVEVTAPGGSQLAATGMPAGWGAGLGVALVALGATLVALRARSRRAPV